MTARILQMPSRGGNPPSAFYRMIWQAIRERKQIFCAYQGLRREACPVVLGYAKDGKEAVFAYQTGGNTSKGGTLPAWRCFYLAEMRSLHSRCGEWLEGSSHRQPQVCVQFVDVDANIPETLTRPEPLPFGSPQLRPPRKTL